MIDKLTPILRHLLHLRDHRLSSTATTDSDADFDISDDEASFDASTPATAPEPTCEHCHQSLTRCAEIKETRLETWHVLHHDDPSEIERRRQEATAVMMRPGASILPDWYTR